MRRYFQDLTLSNASAGFVTVLVGYTSSAAIVFQAARALGADPTMVASWMWALGMGMGLCTLIPSWLLKKPVMIAWSTPGAALVAVAATGGGYTMAQGVGAFLFSGVLMVLVGATGWFEKVMDRIPVALASALLAGVLARFALQGVLAVQADAGLVVLMLCCFLVCKTVMARYAVPVTLVAALAWVSLGQDLPWGDVDWAWTLPHLVVPEWSLSAIIGLGLPLFMVTMASQNLPGVAVIRACGYELPISRIITGTGLATLVLAPFGGFAFNLSSITAAICMGEQAHPDPGKRYMAAVVCGVLYVLLGLFGAAVAGLLLVFPQTMVSTIAALALLGSIGHGLWQAMEHDATREAALITFLVTLSGVSLFGVGSAFWGVAAGTLALMIPALLKRHS